MIVSSRTASYTKTVLQEEASVAAEASSGGARAGLTTASAGYTKVGSVQVVSIGASDTVCEAVALDAGGGTGLANS